MLIFSILLLDFAVMSPKKNKNVKAKKYMAAGTLTSMACKWSSSLRTKSGVEHILRQNSSADVVAKALEDLVPRKSPRKTSTQKEQAI